jgi:hypothetical protein
VQWWSLGRCRVARLSSANALFCMALLDQDTGDAFVDPGFCKSRFFLFRCSVELKRAPSRSYSVSS